MAMHIIISTSATLLHKKIIQENQHQKHIFMNNATLNYHFSKMKIIAWPNKREGICSIPVLVNNDNDNIR